MTGPRLAGLLRRVAAPRVAGHEVTTVALRGAYPFLADAGLGAAGTYIGRDVFGGSFIFDPFELYARKVLTNPNMLVVGQVGAGKSALVKTLLWRQHAFGRAAWIADPKGEYDELAAAVGVTPLHLGPNRPTRLNPFDLADPDDPDGEATRLLAALAGTALHRPLTPVEVSACTEAVTAARGSTRVVTLPTLVDRLLRPKPDAAAAINMTSAQYLDATRDLALVLRRMCGGDLAGMFDAATTVGLTDDAPLLVVNLADVYHRNKEALPLVMACATAWVQAAIRRTPATRRLLLLDEAWSLLAHLGTARWLQQSFKLARSHGVCNIVVLHRFSDLTAAGADGSETARLAAGLLSDTGTRVVYEQPPAEAAAARDLLGLTETEVELLPQLPRGTALWRLGTRSFLVEHRLSRIEAALTDTDGRMTGLDATDQPLLIAEQSPVVRR